MKEKKTQGIMIYQDIPKVFTEEEIKCSTKQVFLRERKRKELRLRRNGKIGPDF